MTNSITIYPVTAAHEQQERGYDPVGFQWGEYRYVTDIREDAPACARYDAITLNDPTDLCELAEKCELTGELTECYLLIAALNKYVACREWLLECDAIDLIDADAVKRDTDWTPFDAKDLDSADADDYEALCDAVNLAFGGDAANAQRAKLAAVLSPEYLKSHSIGVA